jgi:hypothetical protein
MEYVYNQHVRCQNILSIEYLKGLYKRTRKSGAGMALGRV